MEPQTGSGAASGPQLADDEGQAGGELRTPMDDGLRANWAAVQIGYSRSANESSNGGKQPLGGAPSPPSGHWPQVRVSDEFVQLNSAAVLKCRRGETGGAGSGQAAAAGQMDERLAPFESVRLGEGEGLSLGLAAGASGDEPPNDEDSLRAEQVQESPHSDLWTSQGGVAERAASLWPAGTSVEWLTSDGVRLGAGETSGGK